MSADVTRRQLEVLATVLAAGSRKAAARHLGVSPQNVDQRLAELRRRLGVSTTEQAIAILVARGDLEPPATDPAA